MEGSITNNTKELIITSCDGTIKGSVEVDETMSMEKVRNLILEEFDSDMLPDTDDDDWVFVVDGIRLAMKQEPRRLVCNLIDKDVRIETKKKRKDATTTTTKNNKRPIDEAATTTTTTMSNKSPKLLQNQTAAGSNAIITSKDFPSSNNYNNKRTAAGGGSKKDNKEKQNDDDDELFHSKSGSRHSNSKNPSSALSKSTMVEEGRDENNYNYNDTGKTTGKACGMSTKLSTTTTRPEWKERNEVELEEKMPVVNEDEDGKKAKKREDARLRKQKSRENQRKKGVYEEKNNKPKRQKRADLKINDPDKHAAELAARRAKRPKRSDLSEEQRKIERSKDKKRYNEKSQEWREKRNKQKRDLAKKKRQ